MVSVNQRSGQVPKFIKPEVRPEKPVAPALGGIRDGSCNGKVGGTGGTGGAGGSDGVGGTGTAQEQLDALNKELEALKNKRAEVEAKQAKITVKIEDIEAQKKEAETQLVSMEVPTPDDPDYQEKMVKYQRLQLALEGYVERLGMELDKLKQEYTDLELQKVAIDREIIAKELEISDLNLVIDDNVERDFKDFSG